HHLAYVLGERPVVDLDAGEHEEPTVPRGDLEPIVTVHTVVVIGDGEEVVPQIPIARDYLVHGPPPVGKRGMSMQISLQQRHQETSGGDGLSGEQRPEMSQASAARRPS